MGNKLKIKSIFDLEKCRELLKDSEIPANDRGIQFRDNLEWPDQYVITWKDDRNFKIANWVHSLNQNSLYSEGQFWNVEISREDSQPVFIIHKSPGRLKKKFKQFLVLLLIWFAIYVGDSIIRRKPATILNMFEDSTGIIYMITFLIFLLKVVIYGDDTPHCISYLERLIKPEN